MVLQVSPSLIDYSGVRLPNSPDTTSLIKLAKSEYAFERQAPFRQTSPMEGEMLRFASGVMTTSPNDETSDWEYRAGKKVAPIFIETIWRSASRFVPS